MIQYNKIIKNTVVTILLFALAACTNQNKQATNTEVVEEKPKVILATVNHEQVEQSQEFTATVQAEVKNNISPATPVRIEKIFVEVGDKVRKGQKLVQMDNVNLRALATQLQNQETEFGRIDELYKVGGVSKSDWDAKKMQVDITRNSYNSMVENTTLISPINGVITARNYDNGDMFGNANPILTVESITPVKLKINISESYYAKVENGNEVAIQFDVFGDETFKGKVDLIYPTIDPTTRTFTTEIIVPNTNQRIKPGMFARVTLNFGAEQRIVIPDQAIIKQQGSGERYVFVYKDGKVFHTKVELGKRMGNRFELLSGVEDNAQVVVAGQSRLKDGLEVSLTINH